MSGRRNSYFNLGWLAGKADWPKPPSPLAHYRSSPPDECTPAQLRWWQEGYRAWLSGRTDDQQHRR